MQHSAIAAAYMSFSIIASYPLKYARLPSRYFTAIAETGLRKLCHSMLPGAPRRIASGTGTIPMYEARPRRSTGEILNERAAQQRQFVQHRRAHRGGIRRQSQ